MLDRIFDYFTFVKETEFKIIVGFLIFAAVAVSLSMLTNFFRERSQSRREGKDKMIQELKQELEAERSERAELQRRMDEQYADLTRLMHDQRKETAAENERETLPLEKTKNEER